MGSAPTKSQEVFGPISKGKEKTKILILGPTDAGKTTIMYKLNYGEVKDTTIEYCFWAETLENGNLHIECFDLGLYFKDCNNFLANKIKSIDGLIYVLDINDIEIEDFIKMTFKCFQKEEILKAVPILILGNMVDKMQNSDESIIVREKVKEMVNEIGSQMQKNQEWTFKECCGEKMEGVYEGLEWLVNKIKK